MPLRGRHVQDLPQKDPEKRKKEERNAPIQRISAVGDQPRRPR
ncbi:hypothetical protein SynPROS71_01872 [Synechococcus sp. PROS-7-1]|nr:hypothetical protein SynPROS71_01872 [Synechococcus sp. PROS-7-1]